MSNDDSKREDERERIRLLEFQLDYLRAELLHLTHERYRRIYSVSGHIYRFLRPLEQRVADMAAAIMVRRRSKSEAAGLAPTPAMSEPATTALPARRLLVDVTGTIKRDAGTGIQRVVKEAVRALNGGERFAINAFAVRCENGVLYSANAFAASLGATETGPDREVEIAPGDRFLMLSDSWNAFEELAPVLAKIRARGGEIVSCIFDLIPELYPHACHEATVPRYRAWLRKALLESDAFLAISSTVAEELASYVEAAGLPHRPGLKIGWFHCGSDIPDVKLGVQHDRMSAAFVGDAPVFLMVGTIEPRKGHRVALDAFDRLWRQGVDARLIIVGRRGWFEEAVVAAITGHEKCGDRLFWFDDADDAELSTLYDRAAALILPSYAEGFGLPIAEAARRGLPAICSDIPVFREVGRDGAVYFRVNDSAALAEAIRRFLAGERPDPSKALRVSWTQAARRIIDVVALEDWSRRLA